jgi:hypothetical protein
MIFCKEGRFWKKEPHTHLPLPLSVVGVSNKLNMEFNQVSKAYYGDEITFFLVINGIHI